MTSTQKAAVRRTPCSLDVGGEIHLAPHQSEEKLRRATRPPQKAWESKNGLDEMESPMYVARDAISHSWM